MTYGREPSRITVAVALRNLAVSDIMKQLILQHIMYPSNLCAPQCCGQSHAQLTKNATRFAR